MHLKGSRGDRTRPGIGDLVSLAGRAGRNSLWAARYRRIWRCLSLARWSRDRAGFADIAHRRAPVAAPFGLGAGCDV